ncbi:Uncharacterized [Syntrophomonas zehnderi OL-4]|uniref:Uncharacterized n=1 Tax=Syntrophomonas zehnderi OL-4 TaxID=690567 RepID=A0A0E3W2V4_9FIRM|nr:hypothetical protein [Syntrophomonas zehnderi]CFX23572.1 Uncharacterized [Syntrophomonas zehnderi OL-4]
MEAKQYHNPDKIYLSVKTVFYREGGLEPISFLWEDGQEYEISKVTDIRRAASLKAGGTGIRYTCKVHNREVYLFLEEDRWFMERRD